MLLAARSAFMAQKKKLPFDSAVEYLESTGTQWIDTGVVPTTDLEFDFHCQWKELFTSAGQVPMGFRTTSGSQWTFMLTNYSYFSNPQQSYASFFNNQRVRLAKANTLDYVVSFHNGVFSNGIGDNSNVSLNQTSPTVPIPVSWTIYLFKNNQSPSSLEDPFSGKIFYLKMWKAHTLVRDFIPCRIETTGYMYDKVSKRLFGNKGTGNFLYGKDVKVKL